MAFLLPEFKPIVINDLTEFNSLLKKYPPRISEHTFTNLFIWRDYYRFRWARAGDFIALKATDHAGGSYFWGPVGGGDAPEFLAACLEYLEQEGAPDPRIERVPASLAEDIESSGLVAGRDRDQSDYIYRSKDLIELAGREFHAKKNHLNKFRKKYSWSYERITPGIISECREMETEWCNLKQCQLNPGLAGEERAILDAIENIETLNFTGGAIRVNGKIEAFTFGERLNGDTAVIHIEKANPNIEGLYVAINQAFVEAELSSFEFINREQDLGIPGLRKAKVSYNPVKINEKFQVRRKDKRSNP